MIFRHWCPDAFSHFFDTGLSDLNVDTTQLFVLTASNPMQCLDVSASQDIFPEYDERFSVSVDLSNPLDSLVPPMQVSVLIIDDDGESKLLCVHAKFELI